MELIKTEEYKGKEEFDEIVNQLTTDDAETETVEEEAQEAEEEVVEEAAEEEAQEEKPKKADKGLPKSDFVLADTMEGVRKQKDENL